MCVREREAELLSGSEDGAVRMWGEQWAAAPCGRSDDDDDDDDGVSFRLQDRAERSLHRGP